MTKDIELLALGSAYVDINCTDFPFGQGGLLPETETVGDAYEIVPGGAALNFARFCASLGLKAAFVGKVGQDEMGSLLSELLRESGIRPELVSDPEATTNIGLNLINTSGASIMAVAGNAKHRLTSDEAEARLMSLLPETEYLMLGSLFKLKVLLSALPRIVATAKDTDTKIIVDHGRLINGVSGGEKKLVQQLVAQADYYFPSREEFKQLWSVDSIEEGLRDVAHISKAVTVVKDGAAGALALFGGSIMRVPAFPVRPLNTVGAGDSFNAGFIVAQKEGMTIEDSIRFACATAALKVSRRDLPTRDAVRALIQAQADE